MNSPELYRQYDQEEIVSLFGLVSEAGSLCGGQWLVFPRALVCLATVGKARQQSHFYPASRFCWVADRPYRAANDGWAFLPLEVRGGHSVDRPAGYPNSIVHVGIPEPGSRQEERTIHLFVRRELADPFTYVGQLLATHSWGVTREYEFGFARFELSATLPSRVWEKLGGPASVGPNVFALDQSLHDLTSSSSVNERLAILRQLAEYWHGPISPDAGLAEEELQSKQLPYPLRWWYQLAGRRESMLSGQNKLLGPDELELDQDGRLLFYVENQGVYLWSTLPEGNDPPVWGILNEGDNQWIEEGMPLSEFLIGACLFEAIMQAPFGASAACADKSTLDKIIAELRPLSLVPWRWPWYPSKFFGRDGAFMFVAPNDDNFGNKGFSIWIGAKTEQPLTFLKPIVDKQTWECLVL
jgi:hypothetical protein